MPAGPSTKAVSLQLSSRPLSDSLSGTGLVSREGWAVGGACRVLTFDVGEHADDAEDGPFGAKDRCDLVMRLHPAASRTEPPTVSAGGRRGVGVVRTSAC